MNESLKRMLAPPAVESGQKKCVLAPGLLLAGIWLVLIYSAAVSGGVRAPGFSGMFVIILSAAILVGRRAAAGFTMLSLSAGLLLVFAEQANSLPSHTILFTVLITWTVPSVFLVVAGALFYLTTLSLHDSLNRVPGMGRASAQGTRPTRARGAISEILWRSQATIPGGPLGRNAIGSLLSSGMYQERRRTICAHGQASTLAEGSSQLFQGNDE